MILLPVLQTFLKLYTISVLKNLHYFCIFFAKYVCKVFGRKHKEHLKVKNNKIVPKSVNYHFTRQCNYKCGFCFHTAKTSYVLPLDVAKCGLRLLKEAGMEKLNFSGGEPFIKDGGHFMGKLIEFCKSELDVASISIVSNGSLIRESWFKMYGQYLDILAISCDSFNEETNKTIGRGQGKKNHVEKLNKIHQWCQEYKVAFKINTVANTYNLDEDMTENIIYLNPVRWKVFQCLLIDGENAGDAALRNAEKFYITDNEFNQFLRRHESVSVLVPESNEKMKDSYLILDEYKLFSVVSGCEKFTEPDPILLKIHLEDEIFKMRFLDCRGGAKVPSPSLLDVGVDKALDKSGFDEKMFRKRGGVYNWSKKDMLLSDW